MTKPVVAPEDYSRAEGFLPWNAENLVFNAYLEPHWIATTDQFWFRSDRPQGKEFLLVDPKRNVCEPAFDHARLAAAVSSASGKPHAHDQLPFDEFEFVDGQTTIRFMTGEMQWTCDLSSYMCERDDKRRPGKGEVASPDGKWVVSLRDHNLHLHSLDTGEDRPLTEDGEPWYDYGSRSEGRGEEVTDRLLGRIRPPVVVWSPDSARLVTHRLDQRHVKTMPLAQTVFSDGDLRPVSHSFRQALVGDRHIPMAELFIADVTADRITPVMDHPLPVGFDTPIELGRLWWSSNGQHVYVIHESRDYRTLRLVQVDAGTGTSRQLFEEQADT